MSNWQERIRQAISQEQQAVAPREAEVRRRRQEEEKQWLEAARQKQEIIEAIERELALERFNPRELLQQIRDEVWMVGEIVRIKDDGESQWGNPQLVGHALKYKYDIPVERYSKKAYYYPNTDEDPTPKAHRIFEGYEIQSRGGSTSLSICVFRNNNDGKNYVTVGDPEVSCPIIGYPGYTGYKGTYGINVDDRNVQKFIQDMLFESCLRRTREHKLPLDLKTQSEQRIKDLVPWNRRLF